MMNSNTFAFSTKEAEVIILAHSCRGSLSIIDMVASLSDEVGLPKDLTIIHVSIHEDIAGALILADSTTSIHAMK